MGPTPPLQTPRRLADTAQNRLRRLSILSAAVLLVACSRGARVEGLISEIEVTEGRPSAITVESEEGPRRILIDPERDYGFDLGHLEEHRDQADPVSVIVKDEGGGVVALSIDDANGA